MRDSSDTGQSATPPACACASWALRKIMLLGSDTVDFLDREFVRVAERTPWVYLVRCRGCGHPWYAAIDTVDDEYYFRRLTGDEVDAIERHGVWPTDFDGFASVWPATSGESMDRVRKPWSK